MVKVDISIALQQLGNCKRDDIDTISSIYQLTREEYEQLSFLKKIQSNREHNYEKLNKHNIEYISLGESCIGRTIPTRWGLIKTKKLGRISMPFDLAVHYGVSVFDIINSNFHDYMNQEQILFDSNLSCWRHSKYHVIFNHDSDLGCEDGLKLISRYESRVENFLLTLKKSHNIVFIYSMFKSDYTEFDKLIDSLKVITNKPFHIIVLNHREKKICSNNIHVTIVNCFFPSPTYVWHDPTYYATTYGYDFEKNIVDNIIDISEKFMTTNKSNNKTAPIFYAKK